MDLKEQILARADIIEVVSEAISLKKTGSRYFGCCPIHKEKTPSLCVNPQMQTWHCFGCGEGGNAIDFVMATQGLTFWDAMVFLAKKYDIKIPERRPDDTAEGLKSLALYEANKQAQRFFVKELEKSERAKAYVEKRWGLDFAKQIGIGYAPDEWHALDTYVIENNLNRKIFEELGLIKINEEKGRRFDFFRDRVTIPIYSRTGEVIGFTARYIGDEPDTPKYFNSSESAIYSKSNSLFGINYAAKAAMAADQMFIVEGAPDVLRLEIIGFANAVACLGSRCTEAQMRQIQRYTNNLCFIPDADVLKAGQSFATGIKGTIDNAKLALSVGLSVSVRELPQPDPTVKVDADSYLTTPDRLKELQQTDFILWYSNKIMPKGADVDTDEQAKAINEIAATIALIDDETKAGLLVDKVATLSGIKGAKAMLRKAYLNALADRMEHRNVRRGKGELDLYETYGFWIENNGYISAGENGKPKQWSNFTLEPLFHIKDVVFPKRLFSITNGKQTEIVELKAEDLVSLQKFKQKVEGLGNFIWQVKDEQLTKLKTYLYEQTETAVEIKQLGWNRDGFFAFGNGLYKDGQFCEADDLGIVRLDNGNNYYLPSKSMIYANDRTLFEFEKNFSHLGYNNCTLTEAFTRIGTVYGNNGIIGLAFYVASLFKDVVLHNTSLHFPILNLFGPKGSGKTELAVSLKRFFQLKDLPLNLNNTTIAAIANNLAQVSNAIVHFDEFRNDLDTRIRESLKGVWDNTGRSRMSLDRDKQVESTLVDCALILSGQEMATADIALFSRFVFLRFSETTFSAEAKKNFNELAELQRKGFSHITLQLLNYRPQVEREIGSQLAIVSDQLNDRLGKTVIEDRILGNYKVLLVVYKIISKYLTLPYSYEQVFNICYDYMIEQQSNCFTSNELANFWECVQVLVQQGEMVLDCDFKIEPEKVLKTDLVEVEYQTPRLILYLRPSRVFQLYAKQYRSLGETCLPRQSLKYYLEQSKEYLGKKASMRFKMIVKGVEQTVTKSTGTATERVTISQNDRAMAFDYEAVKSMFSIDINSYGESENEQQDLPLEF